MSSAKSNNIFLLTFQKVTTINSRPISFNCFITEKKQNSRCAPFHEEPIRQTSSTLTQLFTFPLYSFFYYNPFKLSIESFLNFYKIRYNTSWYFHYPTIILLPPIRGSSAGLVSRESRNGKMEDSWRDHKEQQKYRHLSSVLRQDDVRKALQLFVDTPIASKCDTTFTRAESFAPCC